MFITGPTEREKRIEERLRPLRTLCWGLAASVAVSGIASWFLVEGLQIRLGAAVPREVPVVLSILSMVLILLSSRLRTTLLRGGLPRNPAAPVEEARLFAAYRKATVVSFATLNLAAFLGLLIALFSGTVFYGIFLSAAAGFAMSTRWPRAADAERIASGRRSP